MKVFVRIAIVIVLGVGGYFAWQQREAASLNAEGVRLMEAGKHKEAISVLERAHAKSGDARIARNLATAYEQVGNQKKALESAREAQRKNPGLDRIDEQVDRIDVRVNKAAYLKESARKRIEKLKAEGRKADPSPMKTVDGVVFTMLHMDDFDRAIYVLEAALLQYPDDMAIEQRIQDIERQRENYTPPGKPQSRQEQ